MIWVRDEGTGHVLDLAHALLDDFAPLAIQDHETGDGWRVFFRSTDARDGALRALASGFGSRVISLTAVEVPDDGWARRNQASLTAVRIGRVVVAPPWASGAAPARAGADEVLVVIEPSMGFGTGHHATTRLCLRLLQRVAIRGLRAVDVGTGSGVLAIAAWKLGAAVVAAIDCDPDALQNAWENVRRNGGGEAISIHEIDLGTLAGGAEGVEPGDVVLANLTASTLERYAAALARHTRPGGHLIVSGFAPGELGHVERAFGRPALEHESEEEWAAAVFDVPTSYD